MCRREFESGQPSAQRSHRDPRNMHLSNAEVSMAEAPLASTSPRPARDDPLTRSPISLENSSSSD